MPLTMTLDVSKWRKLSIVCLFKLQTNSCFIKLWDNIRLNMALNVSFGKNLFLNEKRDKDNY